MFDRYFPLGIAEGEAFLGRTEETARLVANLKEGRHTLLLSPRRYGKTSLAKNALKNIHYDHVEIDLFLAFDERSIATKFLNGIESLIQKTSDTPEQWFKTLLNFFKKSDKKWTIGIKGLKLELIPENQDDIADNLLSGLQALEHVLSKQQKHAVIFVDEFQEINKLPSTKIIEGAIRNFAQSSKYLVFIFSGSNRHLLVNIFGDRSRPLYALCDWLNIERLNPKLYRAYLNKVATKTWKSALASEIIDTIIALTECHPEATYNLCSNLWSYCKNKLPTQQDVTKVWAQLIKEHLKQTRLILAPLSGGQMRLLVLIALGFNKELSGKEAQNKINLTSPSIVKALAVLEADDFIEKREDHSYRIIDPIIKGTLENYYTDYLQ